jgi:transcriptional regulator of acetoin/glycerol metabolism
MNIRELAQTVAACAVLATDGGVAKAHLPATIGTSPTPEKPMAALGEDDDDVRRTLVAALARHGGNVSEVAREMGKARMQIQRWMKRWGLDRTSFKP